MSPDSFHIDPIKEDEQDKIKQGVTVKIKRNTDHLTTPNKVNIPKDTNNNYRKG